MTKVFLAGATGAIGKRLVPQLLDAGYEVYGTTRSGKKASELQSAGVTPIVVDVFDAPALSRAMMAIRPEILIHQLTDLPADLEPSGMAEGVDAAAQAALLAIDRGDPGIFNIAEDDGFVSITKARRELGWDSGFRLLN